MDTKYDLQYNVSCIFNIKKWKCLLSLGSSFFSPSCYSAFPPAFSAMDTTSLYNKTTIICEVSECYLLLPSLWT